MGLLPDYLIAHYPAEEKPKRFRDNRHGTMTKSENRVYGTVKF